MACDRHQLAIGETVLGADRLERLAQPMRRHALEPGFGAAVSEPVAEAGTREGLAELGDEKGEVAARAAVEDVLQRRQHRQDHPDRLPAGILRLREPQFPAGQVLAPQPHDVGPALAGVEQEREGEARLGADRMAGLEGPDLDGRPGGEAFRPGAELADLGRRVLRCLPRLDGPGEQRPERLQAVVRGLGRVGLAVA